MTCAEWIALVDVIITAILTAIIIIQTGRLNKKQQKNEEQAEIQQRLYEEQTAKQQQAFEERLNQQQIELQKRQIQVNTFPYKREVYSHVFSVLELCHMLKDLTKSVDLKSKTAVQLREFFEVLLEQYVPDKKQALWSMREAEYILPDNISSVILDIRSHFDSLCCHFYTPSTLFNVLTEQEFKGIIENNVDEAIKDCDAIVGHTWFIETILPRELNIAGLNK